MNVQHVIAYNMIDDTSVNRHALCLLLVPNWSIVCYAAGKAVTSHCVYVYYK